MSETNDAATLTQPTPPTLPKPQLLKAFLFLLAAHITFVLLDSTGKLLAKDLPVPIIAVARNGFHLLFMALVLGGTMGWSLTKIKHPKLQIPRALALTGFTFFFFTALKTLPLAEATAINFITPFFVMLLAGPALGERVGWWRWLGAGVGFCGMLLVIRPGANLPFWGVVFALLTVACNIAFQLLNRKLSHMDDVRSTIFFAAAIGLAIALAMLPFSSLWGPWPTRLSATQIALLLSMGITGSISQYFLIRAYFYSSASFIATLVYLQIIWATLAGFSLFGQWPDVLTFAGIAVISMSGVGVALFEMRRNRKIAVLQ